MRNFLFALLIVFISVQNMIISDVMSTQKSIMVSINALSEIDTIVFNKLYENVDYNYLKNIFVTVHAVNLTTKSQVSSSGVIIKKENKSAYILTANHVIQDGEFPVVQQGFDICDDVVVIKRDYDLDLAILRVNREFGKDQIKGIKYPHITEKVYNISNKHSTKESYCEGYYSTSMPKFDGYNMAINGGSSGSPIVNKDGQLVGIIVAFDAYYRAKQLNFDTGFAKSPKAFLIKMFVESVI